MIGPGESDEALRRVIIDAPPDVFPDLMRTLGDFATTNDGVTVHFDNTADNREHGETAASEQEPNYNPDLVTKIREDDGNEVHVITASNIRIFEKATEKTSGRGISFFNSVCRHSKGMDANPALIPFVFFQGVDVQKEVVGIYADRAERLQIMLNNGVIDLPGVGDKQKTFFAAFCANLTKTENDHPAG